MFMRTTLFLAALLSCSLLSARRPKTPVSFDVRQFAVSINYMDPLRWSSRPVGYGYELAVSGDTVSLHLPYMGVVHQASMENEGLNFAQPIEAFQCRPGRKGRTEVMLACRRGFVSYLLRLTVYPNGRVSVHLSPSNADSIGYDGELEEKP